jgi:hypothetical protein
VLFDKGRTKSQLNGVFLAGLEQKAAYWNLGYPLLTQCFPTLKYGIWWIVAPENVGKCARDFVLLEDGSYQFIGDLEPGDRVLTLGETSLEPHPVRRLIRTGIKPSFRVTLYDGSEVVVTKEHPFLTRTGWRNLGDLQVGDVVGVPNELPCGALSRDARELRLIGYLLGDGGLGHGNVYFTNANPEIVADFQTCLPDGYEIVLHATSQPYTYRVRGTDGGDHGGPGRKGRLRIWCEEVGLWGSVSHTKRLPDFIYQLNESGIVEVLRGLFATDAHLPQTREIEYVSTSKELAYGVKRLLLRLGIRARISKRSHKRGRDSYRVYIGSRGSQIDRLWAKLRVPGKSVGEHPCVQWIPITKVELLGDMEVFDIEVEGTHNFIGGDDIFLHNSMFEVNLGLNVLAHNEDAYWLDFSLDDSVEERWGYVLARSGQMKIDEIHMAGDLTDEQKQSRKEVFKQFSGQYGERYHLVGISERDKEAKQEEDGEEPTEERVPYSVEEICAVIMAARQQIGKEPRLFVTIDGFHDMTLQSHSDGENDRQRQKSQYLKRWSQKAKALCVVSTHSIKNSRQRGLTADVIKGDGTMLYDGKIISQLYCDVNLNRENAMVAWYDEKYPDTKLPVHELDILKNKAGGTKRVVFYNYLPSMCWDHEVDPETQDLYRSYIYSKKVKANA